MLKRAELPNDTNALRDLVLAMDQRVEHLSHQVEMLTRRLYGPSSEKRHDAAGQQMLFELPAAPTQPEALEVAAVVPKDGSRRTDCHRIAPETRMPDQFQQPP